jgi:hypothetical protein
VAELTMSFASERELVHTAMRHLPLRQWLRVPKEAYLFQKTEVQGLFGIPDLVAAFAAPSERETGPIRSIAFEMKLSNWRRGLMQAFRYRSFASTVFLVIDDAGSRSAVANSDRFKRANIGLVGLNADGSFHVYVWPEHEDPYSPELQSTLNELVRTQSPTDFD